MMKKKYIIFLVVICFILCGCSNVYDMSLESIIDKSTSRNVKVYNKYRKGYKYNLPMGLRVSKSTDYNEIILDKEYTYYLFVDAVSYYNKVIDTYKVNEESYVSLPISFEDKYGYLEINKIDNDKYFIEIMYNYAKIELMVDIDNVNNALINSINILKSIVYDDRVIETMLRDDNLTYTEENYNMFDKSNKKSSVLNYTEDEEVVVEDKIKDTDLIN